jgi:tripeptide aminopeptidase
MNRVASLAQLDHARHLRQTLDKRLAGIVEETVAIQQIAAPTFAESARAHYVQGRFAALPGLDSISTDSLYNVYARLPGKDSALPALLVAAHTDTVFPADTPLTARRTQTTIQAPGIGDNSMGVGALLALADSLTEAAQAGFTLASDVWLVANSREEGMGDLGGIKAVYQTLKAKLGAAIILEGMALGRIYHAGIAVRRLRITCKGPGGHSWLHFGRPSAIHGLMRLGAQIAALQPPDTPRTTYNIGVIEGGTSINTIAAEAAMLLDLRSESPDALANLEKTVLRLIEANQMPDLSFSYQVVGDRPAGSIPRGHPLVQTICDVLQWIGLRPSFEIGSTDANVPLANGLPAVTIGITNGANAHRLDEYIETEGILLGMWQLLLAVLAASQNMADYAP